MPALSAEQKRRVEQWAASGSTLNDIQQLLKSEFNVSLTYLDARLLLVDLGIKLQDKPREKEPEPELAPPTPPSTSGAANQVLSEAEETMDDLDQDLPDMAGDEGAGKSQVSVTLDQITVPGAVVSGKVTFSDGKTAGWYVDQFMRLGMRTEEPGYQPPPADIPVFQRELDRVLQRQGF